MRPYPSRTARPGIAAWPMSWPTGMRLLRRWLPGIAGGAWRRQTNRAPGTSTSPPFGPTYPLEAVDALVAAGEAARAQHANREALRWCELGLQIVDQLVPAASAARIACHTTAGQAASRLGEFEVAASHLQAAFDLRRTHDAGREGVLARVDLACLIGRMRMRQGRHVEALEWMAQARGLVVDERDDAAQVLLALIEAHTGAVHHWRGDTEAATAHYRTAIDLAERGGAGRGPALAEAYNGLGVVLRGRGHLDEAQTCYQHALGIWQALGRGIRGRAGAG